MERLGEPAVRDWAGDFEIGKGRPYVDGVVGATRHAGRFELSALVRGTRTRPYRVTVKLAGPAVAAADCTCPVGGGGKCKHVAAVLLAYSDDPDRFPDLDAAEQELPHRDDLLALVNHLLASAPELRPHLLLPTPGSGRPASAGLFRQLAADVIRAARLYDEWTEYEVLDGLRPLGEVMNGSDPGDEAEAAAGIADALRDGGLMTDRMREALEEPFWRPVAEALFGNVPRESPPF